MSLGVCVPALQRCDRPGLCVPSTVPQQTSQILPRDVLEELGSLLRVVCCHLQSHHHPPNLCKDIHVQFFLERTKRSPQSCRATGWGRAAGQEGGQCWGTSTLSAGSLKPGAAAEPPPGLHLPVRVQQGQQGLSCCPHPPQRWLQQQPPLYSPSLPEETSHTNPGYYYLSLPPC